SPRRGASSSVESFLLRRGRRRRLDQRVVPVLVGLAVHEAPGIEPRRVVGLARIARILVRARREHGHVVAFGDDSDDLAGENRAAVGALLSENLREEVHDRVPARVGVRVVLVIGRGEPLGRAVPLTALQELALDMQRRLLVSIELRIARLEQCLGILDADHGLLREQREARDSGRDEYKGRAYFHCGESPGVGFERRHDRRNLTRQSISWKSSQSVAVARPDAAECARRLADQRFALARATPSAGESTNAIAASWIDATCSLASSPMRAENVPISNRLSESPSTSGCRAPIARQSARSRRVSSALWARMIARAGWSSSTISTDALLSGQPRSAPRSASLSRMLANRASSCARASPSCCAITESHQLQNRFD